MALAERRAHVAALKSTLRERDDEVDRLRCRGREVAEEHRRFSARLTEAQATAGVDVATAAADGGGGARAAAAARLRSAGEAVRADGEALSVLNAMTPWRLEGVSGAGGDELVLRVGRLFRVTLHVGSGAGRVMLAEGDDDSENSNRRVGTGRAPGTGCLFASAVAGAPFAWNAQSATACDGDLAAVLQSLVPGLRRAEEVLSEAEECRGAFPRITRVCFNPTGDLELSFTDFGMERKVDVALSMARGAYPRGALGSQVSIVFAGAGPKLPSTAGMENAIERVPAGASGRRLFGICRLVDWLMANGEAGMHDAAQAAAEAARPPPAPPPPPPPPLRLDGNGANKAGAGGDNWYGYGVLPRVHLADSVVNAAATPAATTAAHVSAAVPAAISAAAAAAAEPMDVMQTPRGPSALHRMSSAAAAARGALAAAAPSHPPGGSHPAVTPAGFKKGSNPLFDDSDSTDAMMD